MSNLPCCEECSWVSELDLGHADGFEYVLGKCNCCGAYWMSVFCVASAISGYEPVKPGDVEHMRSLTAGPARKAFMRDWGDKNL